jgi:restriction endonuclease S subunit
MISNNEYNNLPENWILTTIGEIGIVVGGSTPSTNQPVFWGGDIAWIAPADLSNYKENHSDLLDIFKEIQELTSKVKDEIYRLLVEEFKYFE